MVYKTIKLGKSIVERQSEMPFGKIRRDHHGYYFFPPISIFSSTDNLYTLYNHPKTLGLTFGRGPILWKSYKQKSVTKSSCEAEILALSDMVSIAIWMKDMYRSMTNVPDFAVDIYEDNKAAIHLVSNGMSTSDRSRHIHIRNNYVG